MIKTILGDPVALTAVLILLGGTVILLWALKKWFESSDTEEPLRMSEQPPIPEPVVQAPAAAQAPESVDLIPQLIERLNQMTERLYLIEKKEPEGPTMEMAHKLEMIGNRLMALESIVQQNTPKTGTATFDKEISMAFRTLTDRISVLEKAVQALQSQESSRTIKREVI